MRRAAVLGLPIAHSLSPTLHRAAYASLGLDDWRYDAIEIGTAQELAELVRGRDETWAGLSLTMPLKRMVQPLLDVQSDVAAATGSVNTVVFDADGAVRGDNTDVVGLVEALRESGVQRFGAGVVLGGGATAASAVAALGRLGCTKVRVVVRSVQRAVDLVDVGRAVGVDVDVRAWHDGRQLLGPADVVVSTVPATAQRDTFELLGPDPVGGLLLDVTYHPWPSALATRWRALGGAATGGFAMLLHQAAEQVRLMTGRSPDVERMRAAGEAVLRER